MDRSPVIALFLFLAALAWGFVLACGLVYAARTGRIALARFLGVAMGGGLALYGALLLATSFSSREIVLEEGSRKSFCGFYLDCHLGFTVRDARFEDGAEEGSSPGGGARSSSDDRLCIVELEINSDARRITMTPGSLDIAIVDRSGHRWHRDRAAEERITGKPFRDNPFDQPLPAGEAYRRTVVFRLPATATDPRLLVRENFWADRIIETFLIGDDDSLLHRRTYFSLGGGQG